MALSRPPFPIMRTLRGSLEGILLGMCQEVRESKRKRDVVNFGEERFLMRVLSSLFEYMIRVQSTCKGNLVNFEEVEGGGGSFILA